MKDIGDFLRERREARGISLIEVEKDLKIRKKYLQALEEGNIDIIPGKTYIIGYLRNYSKYLGIDEENINSIIQTYKSLEKRKYDLEDIKEENIFLKKKDKSIFKKRRILFPVKYVYLASFILIIFIGLLWINNSLKKAQDFPVPSPEIETKTDVIAEEKTNNIITLAEEYVETKTETLIKETLSPENVLISKMPILKIIANDNTWVKILSKEEIIFEGILFKGEEIFWQSDQSLNLITEYPAKIETYYNDEAIEINKGITNNYILKYNFNPILNI
ncbi:MAG: helix-turn-helix domain-containing protein [Candidatus Atribacteria bacterium]